MSSLPGIGDVELDGIPLLATLDREPGRLESLLEVAARTASRNHRDETELLLRVRRELRELSHIRRSYELDRRRYMVVLRQSDQLLERLVAPPGLTQPATPQSLKDLVSREAAVLDSQNRLVDLWTTFRGGRLALYRDLGTLPCEDWDGFYRLLTCEPSPIEAPPPGPEEAAPAPPAPPAPRSRPDRGPESP